MNRVGVVLDLLDAVPATYDKGDLAIIDSLGVAVATGAVGPYANPTMLDLFVGLGDGSAKQIGTINPRKFTYKCLAYVAAVGKTVRVGYSGSTGKLVSIDPTLVSSLTKFGTLRLTHVDMNINTIPGWGDTFVSDIQIASGDTVTTLYVKLQAAATDLAAKVNAKYGAGTVAFTSGSPVLNAGSSYLQFVFAAGKGFTVTLDGIFDGTLVTTTAGTAGPFVSGLTGAEVIEKETEAAVLDGYNPNQKPKYVDFNLPNYIGAVAGTNYDAIEIVTTLPKEYEAPEAPTGWDVSMTLFMVNAAPGAKNTLTVEIETLLAAILAANQGITGAEGDALFLTKTEADALYAHA